MNTQKLVLPILAGVVVALAACVPGYNYQAVYHCTGPYLDPGCKYPTYAGAVIIDGKPYQYLHYRDANGSREYYLNGVWRSADIG